MNFTKTVTFLVASLALGLGQLACSAAPADEGSSADEGTVEQRSDALYRARVTTYCFADPHGSSFCPAQEVWCCDDANQPRTCGCHALDDIALR